MSLKPLSMPSKRLAASITSTDSSFQVNNILGWDGAAVSAADFGTTHYVVFRNSSNTLMELMEIDPATIASSSITITKRGLDFTGDLVTQVTANKQAWLANETIVEFGSNPPQLYQWLKEYIDGIAISGSPNASATTKGIVEVATSTEIDNNTATGGTGAALSVSPDQLVLSKYGTRLPTAGEKQALVGGGGTPSSSNLYLTQESATTVNHRISEETSSGIIAGVPVFMQSDNEASKTATVKTFISAGRMNLLERFSNVVGDEITRIAITWMTENLFASTFQAKSNTGYYNFAVVGAITKDGQISIFDTKQIDGHTTSTSTACITRLSDSKFIVSYSNGTGQNKTVVISMDSSYTMTVGTAVTTSANDAYNFSIARLSDSSFIAAYVTPSTAFDATVAVATVSGTTQTWGSAVTVDTTNSTNPYVIGLSSTSAIVAWSVSGAAKVQQVSISGTTATLGGASYNVSTVQEAIYLAPLSSTSFAMAYNDSITTGNVKARLATVAADVITLGSAITVDTFNNSSWGAMGIGAFGSDFVVAYQYDQTAGAYGSRFAYVKASGTTATLGNIFQLSDLMSFCTPSTFPVITTINGYLVIALDVSGSDVGCFITFKPVFNEVPMGVAKAAPSSGVVTVIQKGRTGSLYSGLTFGKKYLFKQDGTISETGIIPGGTAISTTEILLD